MYMFCNDHQLPGTFFIYGFITKTRSVFIVLDKGAGNVLHQKEIHQEQRRFKEI